MLFVLSTLEHECCTEIYKITQEYALKFCRPAFLLACFVDSYLKQSFFLVGVALRELRSLQQHLALANSQCFKTWMARTIVGMVSENIATCACAWRPDSPALNRAFVTAPPVLLSTALIVGYQSMDCAHNVLQERTQQAGSYVFLARCAPPMRLRAAAATMAAPAT